MFKWFKVILFSFLSAVLSFAQMEPGKGYPGGGSGTATTSSIHYTASGASTPLTLQQKLDGQAVDIRSFGAVMNTTTDQTAVFTAAITYLNSVGGGTIHIPNGFIYANVVINKHGITLEGPGIAEMQHTPSSNFLCAYNPLLPAVQISDGTTITSGSMVRNLCISDPSSSMHTGILFADGAYECGLDHVQINNFTTVGLKFECDNIHPTSFNHCIWIQIQTNASGAYGIQYLDNGDNTNGWVTECNVDHFFATVGKGYQVVNKGNGNTLSNGYLQCGMSGWGILIQSGSIFFNAVTEDSMNNPPIGFLAVQATIDAGYDYRIPANWANAQFIQGHLNAAGSVMVIAGHTTGTTTTNSPAVTVAATTGITPGRQIHIPGAGVSSSPLIATVLSISGTTLTLDTNATYAVSSSDVGYGDISRSFENIGSASSFAQAPGFAFQASNIKDLGSSFQDKLYQSSGSGVAAPFNNAGIIQQTGVGHSYAILQPNGGSQAAISSVVQGNVATSPSSAGTVVTVTTSTAHGAITGDLCTVIGANQQGINTFCKPITVLTSTSYTYTSDYSIYTSAATGTITQTIYKSSRWMNSILTIPNQLNFQDNLTGLSHPVLQNSGVLGASMNLQTPNQTSGYWNMIWGSGITTGTGVVFGSTATNYLWITGNGTIQQLAGAGSTTNGSFWYDSTQLAPSFYANGVKESITGTIFTQTADGTNGANTAATNILGTGIGTVTLPSSYSLVGKTIRVRIIGTITTAATPGTTILSLNLNAATPVAVMVAPSLTIGSSQTNIPFDIYLIMTYRSTTSVVAGGTFTAYVGSNYAATPMSYSGTIVAATSYTIQVTATNSVASGTVYTTKIASVEVLN